MPTVAEEHVLFVVSGRGRRPGSFTEALIRAIFKADGQNRNKLETLYPEEVAAVKAFERGWLKDERAEQEIEEDWPPREQDG